MGKNLIAHFFAVSTKNIKLPGVLRQFDAISLEETVLTARKKRAIMSKTSDVISNKCAP